MRTFEQKELRQLYIPPSNSSGEDNGQVTIIAGSELFHGAPMLATTVASRIVDMVFFSSPFEPLKEVADKVKSELFSFIWIPFNEIEKYIEKSDAILIGPGFMRFANETTEQKTLGRMRSFIGRSHEDRVGKRTRRLTEYLLKKFSRKKWVIDGGSLQVMDANWIPEGSIITPNRKELSLLFNLDLKMSDLEKERAMIEDKAKKHKCVIVYKGPTTVISDGNDTICVEGGNAGLTKGGTGDTLAGLTVALLSKNEPILTACAASFIIKKTAEVLYEKVGTNFNSDDVAQTVPSVLFSLLPRSANT